jgi:hypothetical protein
MSSDVHERMTRTCAVLRGEAATQSPRVSAIHASDVHERVTRTCAVRRPEGGRGKWATASLAHGEPSPAGAPRAHRWRSRSRARRCGRQPAQEPLSQRTLAASLRIERADPGERHARPDRQPPSIDRWTGRISPNAPSRRQHDGVRHAPSRSDQDAAAPDSERRGRDSAPGMRAARALDTPRQGL